MNFYISFNQFNIKIKHKKQKVVCKPPVAQKFHLLSHSHIHTWKQKLYPFKNIIEAKECNFLFPWRLPPRHASSQEKTSFCCRSVKRYAASSAGNILITKQIWLPRWDCKFERVQRLWQVTLRSWHGLQPHAWSVCPDVIWVFLYARRVIVENYGLTSGINNGLGDYCSRVVLL